MKTKIRIDRNGIVTFIYADSLASLVKPGVSTIQRVSNVEPCEGGWSAFMIENKITLGPFKLRSEALSAEVQYLEKKLFENPVTPTTNKGDV